MENIFIFIIIIIISSLISKNKKKKASEEIVEKTRNTYSPPKPVNDLRELLRTLKNFDPEQARQTVVTQEYSKPNNYDDKSTTSYDEPNTEAYSTDTNKRNVYNSAKSAEEAQSYKEKIVNLEDISGSANITQPKFSSFEELLITQKKKTHKSVLFDTKSKLKNAIIASEILKRKYA